MTTKDVTIQCPDTGLDVVLLWNGSRIKAEPGDWYPGKHYEYNAIPETEKWIDCVNAFFSRGQVRLEYAEHALVNRFGCEPSDLFPLAW